MLVVPTNMEVSLAPANKTDSSLQQSLCGRQFGNNLAFEVARTRGHGRGLDVGAATGERDIMKSGYGGCDTL